jgi:signal transduction histidine kinase
LIQPTLQYIIPILFGLLAFSGLQAVGEQVLGSAEWLSWVAALITLALGAALTPVWMALAKRLGAASTSHEVEIARTLNEFSRNLSLIADVEPLVNEELGKLKDTVKADRLILMLAEEEDRAFLAYGQRGYVGALPEDLSFAPRSHLAKWLAVNEEPLAITTADGVVEYLSAAEQDTLQQLRIGLVVPLISMNRLVGLLLMGREAGFAAEQLEFLEQLAPRLGLALQNALLLRQGRLRQRRLYRTERLATVGQLAAGAAHEIRNPLTSIRSTIQYLRKDYRGDAEKAELVDQLIAEVDRINQTIAGLLSFARPSDPALESLDLANLLRQTAALVETTARKSKVKMTLDLDDGNGTINGDLAQLKQVFLNLFLNAIQAMADGGELRNRD